MIHFLIAIEDQLDVIILVSPGLLNIDSEKK